MVAAAVTWLLSAGSASATSAVSVFPSPGDRFATPQTQISFRGVAPRKLGRVTITGSRSGTHRGHIKADSDGRGASFYPARRFRAGELVRVRTGLPIVGGRRGTFTFKIATPARPMPQPARSPAPRVPGDVHTYYSRPDLRPTSVRISEPYSGTSDIFLASMHGPLQWGPMIVDGRGSLIWFKPIAGRKTEAADVNVQRYRGQPVLTWWQGFQNYGGLGPNKDVIVNRRYRTIATVRGGNGLKTDLHEFTITPQNTALITAYNLVYADTSSTGGAPHEVVSNCYVQEIDIPTGNVLFQWDSLDHIPLKDSYIRASPFASFYDYFHINSVQQDTDGNLLISGRNTWAVYKVDHRTGKVLWELGGKRSSFNMGAGTRTAYQHDARLNPDGLITIFDNGDWPQVHPQSRVLVERIDTSRHTVTLIRALEHSPSLLAPWEGSAQLLSDGRVFVGWGGLPNFSEFDRTGRQIFDGGFVDSTSSYRVYQHPWSAQPSTRPAVAVARNAAAGTAVYASWNGATDVSRWRVLAGPGPQAMASVSEVPRAGFETSIQLHAGERYVAVQAISASGRVLARSRTIRAGG